MLPFVNLSFDRGADFGPDAAEEYDHSDVHKIKDYAEDLDLFRMHVYIKLEKVGGRDGLQRNKYIFSPTTKTFTTWTQMLQQIDTFETYLADQDGIFPGYIDKALEWVHNIEDEQNGGLSLEARTPLNNIDMENTLEAQKIEMENHTIYLRRVEKLIDQYLDQYRAYAVPDVDAAAK